jgi:hypothetical protein
MEWERAARVRARRGVVVEPRGEARWDREGV